MDLLVDVETDLVYIPTIMIYLQPGSVTQLSHSWANIMRRQRSRKNRRNVFLFSDFVSV